MADTTYLISDVVALAGVSAPQLRSWERAGLLRPARSSGGVRVYAAEDVARVRLIRRSLDNPGRRGSLRRLAERLAADDLRPGPEDWAGLDGRPAGPSDVIAGIGWQAVVDALPAPVAVWDRDGVLAHANPALTALLTRPGLDGGPTLEPSPSDTASLGDVLAAAGPLSPRWVARVGVPQEEVPLILPIGSLEGRTVWHAVPLLGPDGTPRGAAGLGRDISGEALAHLAREGRLAAGEAVPGARAVVLPVAPPALAEPGLEVGEAVGAGMDVDIDQAERGRRGPAGMGLRPGRRSDDVHGEPSSCNRP